jgi:TolA-binding protein
MAEIEETLADYRLAGLTTGVHVMAHLRSELDRRGILTAARLRETPDGTFVRTAGHAIVRQRPGSAKGYCFVTLEDETGLSNAVLTPDISAEFRVPLHQASLLEISGPLQRVEGVIHVRAKEIRPLDLTSPEAEAEMQEAAQELEGLAEQLEDMQQEMEELQDMEDMQQAIDDAKAEMNGQPCECPGGGEGDKPGQGMGEGRGVGRRPKEENQTGNFKSRVRGKLQKGKIVVAGTADGENLTGRTTAEAREIINAEMNSKKETVENQLLPKSQREHTREYFQSLLKGE